MNDFPLQLRNYFSDQYRSVLIHVTNTLDNPSYERIHDLRICLKRIRFIGKILSQYGVSKPKWFKAYTKLFRYAGRIREIQIHSCLLQKFCVDFFEHNFIDKKYLKIKKRLIKNWSGVAIASLHEIIQWYPRITRRLTDCRIDGIQYLSELYEHLLFSFRGKLADDQLHERRKILKGVLYTSELAPAYKQRLSHFCDLKVVSSLEDAIGDWHDLDVMLKQYQRVNKRPEFKNLVKQKNLERIKINKLLPRLIKATRSYSTR